MAATCAFAIFVSAQTAWADGQLDPSFGVNGRAELGLLDSSAADGAGALLPRGDGSFLAVGAGEGHGPWVTQHLFNGALDGSFGTGGGVFFPQSKDSSVSSGAREADGSIVVAGAEDSAGPDFETLVARLTPQGALDPTFGNDPPHPTGDGVSLFDLGGDDLAEAIAIDPSGRILIAGRAGPAAEHDVLLAHINPDGSIDSAFGGPTGVHTNLGGNDIGRAIAMQGGRIVVLASSGPNTYVLGYRPDGTLDPAFGGGDGIAPVGFPAGTESHALVIQPDGTIVVAGSRMTTAYIAGLLPDGATNPGFGSGGITSFVAPAEATGMYIRAAAGGDDGKVVTAVNAYIPKGSIPILLRTLPSGQLDPAWGTNGAVTLPSPPETIDYLFAVAVQADRRVLVAGDTFANENDDRLLFRVLGDTTPPDTAISHRPKGKQRASGHPLKIAFEAVGDVHTTFECKLTRPKKHRHRHHHGRRARGAGSPPATFAACASPITYRHLRRPGRYRFAVRAIDPAGNVDPTPATVKFKLLPKRPAHRRPGHR